MSTESTTVPAGAQPAPAALGAATGETDGARPRVGNGYGALWRTLPGEIGFLLPTLPLAILSTTLLWTLFWTGVGIVVLVFGIFLVIASLYIARGFGTAELVRLEWAGRPAIPRPKWPSTQPGASFWRRVFGPFTDGHYWLYLLHGGVVVIAITVVTWSVTITWLSGALGVLTWWIWGRYTDGSSRDLWLHDVVLDWMFPANTFSMDPVAAEAIFMFIVGAIFLVTMPFVLRGMTMIHWGAARLLLGAWRSEALEREVATLSAARGAAVRAEDVALRRLERDIHDGPQQRIVRLQMDLAAAERRLGDDPEAAAELIAEARVRAQEALDELRALSRGVAPPILQDRGLAAALESLVARSAVPVILEQGIRADVSVPPALERAAYFIAAELLTNAAKHSGATAVRLTTAVRTEAGGDGVDRGARWLDLWVGDNGRGGAVLAAGHGLEGLDERVRGLGGVLVVESPLGGPTTVGAHVPFATLES